MKAPDFRAPTGDAFDFRDKALTNVSLKAIGCGVPEAGAENRETGNENY
jgi:hypothetical protein